MRKIGNELARVWAHGLQPSAQLRTGPRMQLGPVSSQLLHPLTEHTREKLLGVLGDRWYGNEPVLRVPTGHEIHHQVCKGGIDYHLVSQAHEELLCERAVASGLGQLDRESDGAARLPNKRRHIGVISVYKYCCPYEL